MISWEKVWVDRCDCDEKSKTSGLNNIQHNTKQKGATSAEYVSYIQQDLDLNSRLQTVVFEARQKEHLAAVLIWSYSLKRAGKVLEGRAAMEVSAVRQKDP